jgi:hypothetical protein
MPTGTHAITPRRTRKRNCLLAGAKEPYFPLQLRSSSYEPGALRSTCASRYPHTGDSIRDGSTDVAFRCGQTNEGGSVTVRPMRPISLKDLRFFASGETLLVAAGTALLTAMELNLLPASWQITWFINDWKAAVVVVSISLILAPPALSKGFLHLRSREHQAVKNAELGVAMRGIQSRASHLVTKVREVAQGETTTAYLSHSIHECRDYFAKRRSEDARLRSQNPRVEAVYYQLRTTNSTKAFERKNNTCANPNEIQGTLSSRGSTEVQSLVKRIMSGNAQYYSEKSGLAKIFIDVPNTELPVTVAMAVPVLRDRDEGDVTGMLVLMASEEHLLQQSDEEFIRSYAWFVSLAQVLDQTPRVAAVATTGAALLPSGRQAYAEPSTNGDHA